MTAWAILIAIALGVLANEFTELSSWLAVKLARWSARHHYRNPAIASARAEDQARYIIDRPGKLLKLIVALGFAAKATVTRRDIGFEVAVPTGYQPAILEFEFKEEPYNEKDAKLWVERTFQMQQAWVRLQDYVEETSRGTCRSGSTWRKLRRLKKITGDTRWDTVIANMRKLKDPVRRFNRTIGTYHGKYIGWTYRTVRAYTPAEATVAAYVDATHTVHDDILHLCLPGPQ